jgi:hypothetical protein
MKFFIVGIACLVISICFGLQNSIDVIVSTGNGSLTHGSTQNTTAAGTSAGLAIAGGLSLIASALDKKNQA